MKVEHIAETFCNTLDLHKAMMGVETQFFVFFLSGHLRQVLLYDSELTFIGNLFHAAIAFQNCFLWFAETKRLLYFKEN